MSYNDINESIIKYIKNNYENNNYENNINTSINSEIDDILNNINNNACSYEYKSINTQTILGITSTVNKSIIDLTYLIPNLFRKCYFKSKIQVPYVCPKYITDDTFTNYFPYLLEKDLIKSFLYFNFPASYLNAFEIPQNIKTIKNMEIFIKSHKTNIGQNINPVELFNNIYSQNSMLIQLINFQNYLNLANYTNSINKIIDKFRIKWDITISCVSFTNNVNDSYISVNNTNNVNDIDSIIDPATANNIYDIKFSSLNNFFEKNEVNTNKIIILYSQNIYTVLDYVLEVYNDIILQIQTNKSGGVYCKKSYMSIINIPILLRLYNIFYNNQVYSVSRDIPTQSPSTVVPITISLNKYIQDFISIMNTTYGTAITYLKTVILHQNLDAFVFFLNGSTSQSYIDNNSYNYFYINIYNPSVITLINYMSNISVFNTYQPSTINALVIRFNYGFSNPSGTWVGYIPLNNVSYTTNILYPKSALYPNFGLNNTALDSYLYSYYDSKNKLISIVFISIYTEIFDSLSYKFGLGLEIYHR